MMSAILYPVIALVSVLFMALSLVDLPDRKEK